MIFQITKRPNPVAAPPLPGGTQFEWQLQKASGEVIAQSARSWDSEKQARTAIAAAKKSMAGAGRCKVVSPASPMDATVESIPEQRS